MQSVGYPVGSPSGGGQGSSSLYPGAPTYADAESVLDDLSIMDYSRWNCAVWQPTFGATTAPGLHGFPAITSTGTVAAYATSNYGPGLRYATTATAGAMTSAYLSTVVPQGNVNNSYSVRPARKHVYQYLFGFQGTPFMVPTRFFIGMGDLGPSPANIPPEDFTGFGVALLNGSTDLAFIKGSYSSAVSPVIQPTGISSIPPDSMGAFFLLTMVCSPTPTPALSGAFDRQVDWELRALPSTQILEGPRVIPPTVVARGNVENVQTNKTLCVWASNDTNAEIQAFVLGRHITAWSLF